MLVAAKDDRCVCFIFFTFFCCLFCSVCLIVFFFIFIVCLCVCIYVCNRYNALKTPGEKRSAFTEYLNEKRKIERVCILVLLFR